MRQRFIQSFPTSEDIQSALDNKELGKPYVALSREEPSIDWNSKEIDYTGMPLTFEIISGGTIGLKGISAETNYEYQINDGEIVTGQAASNAYTNISLNAGDVIKIRGFLNTKNVGLSVNPDADLVFNIYGNVASLGSSSKVKIELAGKHVINAENLVMLDPNFVCYQLFYRCTDLIIAPKTVISKNCRDMFDGCISLTTAPTLPATKLESTCYYMMFYNCTSLTQAPELPATELASSCYYNMFAGCKSLTKAPSVLPATSLTNGCYMYMFADCTSLTKAPELPATELTQDCYTQMFKYCTSLTKAPELPATTLAVRCYSSMFLGCKSLETAPELPATTLADSCYWSMFSDCTKLTQAPELPATTLAISCYSSMFQSCINLTQAPSVLPATTLASSCYNWMFKNCSSLTTTPALPATTLVDKCYNEMFESCKSLNYIKCLATDMSSDNCTGSWVSRVASTGTFVKHPDATWTTGISGIPAGWTIENAVI